MGLQHLICFRISSGHMFVYHVSIAMNVDDCTIEEILDAGGAEI